MNRNNGPDYPVDMGSRLELFVDRHLTDRMEGLNLRLHEPQKMPLSEHPLRGDYMTVIRDKAFYRAYYRTIRPGYKGERGDGNPGECTCYAESEDGIDWKEPDLGLFRNQGVGVKNAVWAEPPFAHNFSPFLDARPGVPGDQRYKALAGVHFMGVPDPGGLFGFVSADGITWRRISDRPVIPYDPGLHGKHAFDSQNVAFWSEPEERYVSYFRNWKTPHIASMRSIGRATSKDFVNWTDESGEFAAPNLAFEQLYTNQTHPYFRAPHIYIALPTRFSGAMIRGKPVKGNVGSTDILFMSTRAGQHSYERLFREAFMRPGLEPESWDNRANYVGLNVVPTGPQEMSIFHGNGHRYVLRTDGFVSVNAPFEGGELVTKPLVFQGRELVLNLSTSVEGGIRVELLTACGKPLPGCTADDWLPIIGDSVEYVVSWRDGTEISRYAGKPVRIRFVMKDSDLFSFRFR